ncbi:hypothetical protein OPV22_028337 [Ensete ventricosum]|uniref:BRX domain-containing protein n=1 Tax=Ensete ventricosum TaxID=4639 RepID=A0AAV8QA82_ENSVE|nr:hypothetical protein OPV22_028337 [Ensete ventricosum]RWV88902.1 hypothetical protein GW17_00048979 [Ensete ventricosum]RWW63149.1 hypothetical protein BHE74_00029709 [Ensete ventricosum]RZS08870.1 hypothetical protein BHM03_00039899 [Ensete ventricosum]
MRDNADQSRFVKDQEADDAWKEGFREPYHAAAAAHCTLSVAVHAVGPSIGCPARWRMDSSPPRAAASAFSSVSDRLRPTRSPRWAWRSTRYIRARGQRVPASKDGRRVRAITRLEMTSNQLLLLLGFMASETSSTPNPSSNRSLLPQN